jgi:hypothetical protein
VDHNAPAIGQQTHSKALGADFGLAAWTVGYAEGIDNTVQIAGHGGGAIGSD